MAKQDAILQIRIPLKEREAFKQATADLGGYSKVLRSFIKKYIEDNLVIKDDYTLDIFSYIDDSEQPTAEIQEDPYETVINILKKDLPLGAEDLINAYENKHIHECLLPLYEILYIYETAQEIGYKLKIEIDICNSFFRVVADYYKDDKLLPYSTFCLWNQKNQVYDIMAVESRIAYEKDIKNVITKAKGLVPALDLNRKETNE